MDLLMHVKPTMEYKNAAIEYINEFYEYNSEINGSGGLDRYLYNYEGWLDKLAEDWVREPNEEKVPAETYFLVRQLDNKIVGMINIRMKLNEKLKIFGGNIGYSIRPTERQKGYNKINLYLGLLTLQAHGEKECFMDCDKDNPASSLTMLAFGAKKIREYYDSVYTNGIVEDYLIDVDDAIEKNKTKYLGHISPYTKGE